MKHLIVAALVFVSRSTQPGVASPQAIVDELLSADRAFAAASAKTDLVTGLSAMFAEDVVMPNPAGLAYGKAKTIAALRANPANHGARIEWTPVHAGLSGDGLHGFTAGVMTLHQPDAVQMSLKYLAYWEKRKEGWRVTAYKRGRRPQGAAPIAMMRPVMPQQIVASSTNAVLMAGYRDSLGEAERAFSRDAQTMGIGPAFRHYGSPDAINLGGPDTPGFLVGNVDIGRGVGGGTQEPGSPVSWGPDTVIVASSGDFGVSIGLIVPNKPGPDGKPLPNNPFFTIWRRNSLRDPWRYIAE